MRRDWQWRDVELVEKEAMTRYEVKKIGEVEEEDDDDKIGE